MRWILFSLLLSSSTTNAFGQIDSVPNPPWSFTDSDIESLPESAESIKLRGNRGYGNDTVSDVGISHLTNLKHLRSLKAGALELTDAACISISKLTQLEELELDSNKITGEGLRSLTALKNLRRLNLNFNPIKEDDLVVLKEFPLLEEFHLSTTDSIGDATLKACSELPNLQRLILSYETPKVTDEGLKYLSKLKHLKNFSLTNAQVTDAGLAELAKLSNLETLFLYNLRSVKPGSLSFISELKNLKDIEISQVGLNDSDIGHVISRPNLQRLVLWNVFSDRDSRIAKLGQPHQLLVLRTNATLTQEAVNDLQHAEKLKSISDGLTNVDNNGVAMLSKLADLETLYLDSPQITSDAMGSFEKMKSLRTLMVSQKLNINADQWTRLGKEHLTECLIQQFEAPYTIFYKPEVK